MPPVVAAATAIGAGVAGAATAVGAAVGTGGLIAAGTAGYSMLKGREEKKEAKKAGEELAATTERLRQEEIELAEKHAGEYYRITEQQMELQAQSSNIKTLASLIGSQEQQPPRFFTLPPAKTVTLTPTQQINNAIDKWLRG